ncbi:hypothetical protein ACFSKW_49875, partial [Nonomuraea mangrovi]
QLPQLVGNQPIQECFHDRSNGDHQSRHGLKATDGASWSVAAYVALAMAISVMSALALRETSQSELAD